MVIIIYTLGFLFFKSRSFIYFGWGIFPHQPSQIPCPGGSDYPLENKRQSVVQSGAEEREVKLTSILVHIVVAAAMGTSVTKTVIIP